EHLEARNRNHILLAIDDAHASLAIHDADVTGTEEAISSHRFRGLVSAPPVTQHDLRASRANFALFAVRQFVAGIVSDGNLRRGQWQPDGARPFGDVSAIACEHRGRFREPVTFNDRLAGRFYPGIGNGFLYRHAAADRGFEHAPVDLAEVRVV